MTKVQQLNRDRKNLYITFYNPFSYKIKIHQSICHNGICLTIIDVNEKTYSVIASEETLLCSNLNYLKLKDEVNLERGLIMMKERFDGHFVQGHVDTTAIIQNIESRDGSWIFFFKSKKELNHIVVEKGSIAINGISLTIRTCTRYNISISIIPYTYEKTNFHFMKIGDVVNIEFDIIGKYIAKYLNNNYSL
ncbi:riboflavin synthase [Blattabacterium cuenoti]|uniref:riboflavin synthase n=1 Tax=Blattabacterium cuenoti TaxID=1653831 RepID=UPI00293B99D4|nr:riboflavin synthase [Blattabacterium cuenoti]